MFALTPHIPQMGGMYTLSPLYYQVLMEAGGEDQVHFGYSCRPG